ncbi:MAG: dihydrofolate reductase family protein [Actinomycetota bacterium]
MGRLVYAALMSLDGYVADEDGRWDWAIPDLEVHAFVNDVTRPVGTHLYGRRMYEVLRAWETMDAEAGHPPEIYDFAAIWKAADKVVYSRTLETVDTARTRVEREFDVDVVREMKAAAGADLAIGGPELAARAFAAGLVDDVHLFISPAIVGGGTRSLPEQVRLDLELVDERRFGNGVVYLHHRRAETT